MRDVCVDVMCLRRKEEEQRLRKRGEEDMMSLLYVLAT